MWIRFCEAVNRVINSLLSLADSLDALRLTLDTRTEEVREELPDANGTGKRHKARV